MPAGNELRTITIRVDAGASTTQLKAIADAMGNLNTNTNKMANGLGILATGFQSIFGAYLGLAGIKQLASMSDQMQNLNNKLVSLTGTQETANLVFDKLTQISRDTNTSLDATGQAYFRLAASFRAANISQQTLLDLTQTLINTYRLSGQSAEEAAQSTAALSNAFALGSITGRQLRGIINDNKELANELKKAFGPDLLREVNNGFITLPNILKVVRDNMEATNAKAELMKATFGQSFTKLFDTLKIAVFGLSQEFSISSGFAQGVEYLIGHTGQLASAFSIIALVSIPTLVSAFTALGAAVLTTNPWLVLVGALGVAFIRLNSSTYDLTEAWKNFTRANQDIKADFIDLAAYAVHLVGSMELVQGSSQKMTDQLKDQAAAIRDHNDSLYIEEEDAKIIAQIKLQEDKAAALKKFADDMLKVKKLVAEATPQQQLAQLNAEFTKTGNIEAYSRKIASIDLARVKREFQDGKADLEKLNKAIDAFHVTTLNLALKNGVIGIKEYREAVSNIGLDALDRQLNSGMISIQQYNREIAALSENFSFNSAARTGLQDYVDEVGTASKAIAGGIKNTFDELGNEFSSFIKTGTFNFAQFTQNVLDDLTRIIVRSAIIQPLAQGLLNLVPSGATQGSAAGIQPASNIGDGGIVAAKGAAFDHGLTRFASGGIVSAATQFGYGNGQRGIMGEAGPEAILPLARTSGGNLGVQATVTPVNINIVNNSGADIAQRETTGPSGERTIELLIQNKVRDGLASGSFDKAFHQSYGLRRRGS